MYTGARTVTMTEALFPRVGVWRDIVLVLAGTLLTALAAQVSIPLFGEGVSHPVAALIASGYGALGVPLPNSPVPITGQTFAVLLLGALLGGRLAFVTLLAYLAEGLMGLPVFSLGRNAWSPSSVGVPWIMGPTVGYVVAYPFAAYVVGRLAERGWDRHFWSTALAMLTGSVIIYLVAIPWLAVFVGAQNAVPAGLLPFIPGDVVKLVLAALLLPTGWAALGRLGLRR